MPIYEYKCRKCGAHFEALLLSSQEESGIACPECKGDDVERMLSCFSTASAADGAGKSTGCAPGASRGFS